MNTSNFNWEIPDLGTDYFLWGGILQTLFNQQDTDLFAQAKARGLCAPIAYLKITTGGDPNALITGGVSGEFYFNTADKELFIYTGTTWTSLGVLPNSDISFLIFAADGQASAVSGGITKTHDNVVRKVSGGITVEVTKEIGHMYFDSITSTPMLQFTNGVDYFISAYLIWDGTNWVFGGTKLANNNLLGIRLSGGLEYNPKPHGIFNAKVTVSGTTVTLTTQDGTIGPSNPMIIASRKPVSNSGEMIYQRLTSDLSLTLASSTATGSVADITSSIFGVDPTIAFFVYLVLEDVSGTITPYLAISRAPYHKIVPSGYYYNNSSTTRSTAGSPDWAAMWISKNTTVVSNNTSCICLGNILVASITRTNGLASGMGTLGPLKWNDITGIWQSWQPVFTGFSVDPVPDPTQYRFDGDFAEIYYYSETPGTSNATAASFSVPFRSVGQVQFDLPSYTDNGTEYKHGIAKMAGSASVVDAWPVVVSGSKLVEGTWTATGNKEFVWENTISQRIRVA